MKIAIIGGAGRVGSTAAYALQLRGLGREVVLVDVNEEAARGEALDLLHGTAVAGAQRFAAGGIDAASGADLVIIAAGLLCRPDESRLDLVRRSLAMFREILGQVTRLSLPDSAVVLVVSDPVDVLTYVAATELRFDPHQVLGLGTQLDTIRFRSHLAAAFGADPTQVQAVVLGEHGDSQVPVWSSATVGGVLVDGLPGADARTLDAIAERTRAAGAEVARLKGGAGHAVGLAVAQVVEAVVADSGALLPVSTLQEGLYGVQDICYSLPTRVTRRGWHEHVAPRLWQREESALANSGRVLRDLLDQVL